MASKLERAQHKYESLLRSLGDKARLVGMLDKASDSVLETYKRAEENLDDKKFELEFIESEIHRLEALDEKLKNQVDDELGQLKSEIKELEELVEIKRSKIDPVKKKLAGAAYDLKFVEKGLEEETRKFKEKTRREEFKAAKAHEENIKKMKIELLKRRKAMMDMKRKMKELEGPAKKMEKELDELKEKLDELKENADETSEEENSEMLDEMRAQQEKKTKEIIRAEKHLKDVLADVGEDLYEKRISHPVLNKFYADLDVVSKTIDSLQEE